MFSIGAVFLFLKKLSEDTSLSGLLKNVFCDPSLLRYDSQMIRS